MASFALELLGLDGGLEKFERLDHGAKGFAVLYQHPSGLRIAAEPRGGGEYCSVTMSGEVAQCVAYDSFKMFAELDVRYNVSRLDFAFDTDKVFPSDIYEAVRDGRVRSLAKRETLCEIKEPFKEGSHTVYFGSRKSERYLRVYLRDGHTRVECEMKDQRALGVFKDLLKFDSSSWPKRCMAHLLDFVDFDFPGWRSLVADTERAKFVLARLTTNIDKVRAWVWTAVAPSLALLAELDGADVLDYLVLHGFDKFTTKHRALLAGVGDV